MVSVAVKAPCLLVYIDLHADGPVCAVVVPLKRRQMIAAQLGEGVYHVGTQKGIDILRNKSAISGPVLGPVRVVAHASTAGWNQSWYGLMYGISYLG